MTSNIYHSHRFIGNVGKQLVIVVTNHACIKGLGADRYVAQRWVMSIKGLGADRLVHVAQRWVMS